MKLLLSALLLAVLLQAPSPLLAQTVEQTSVQQTAQTLAGTGEYLQAAELLRQHLRDQTLTPGEQIVLLKQLADYEQKISREDAARRALTQALNLARQHGLAEQAALMQLLIAELALAQGRYDEALQEAEAARLAYAALRVPGQRWDVKGSNGLSRALMLKARIYALRGEHEPAVHLGNESLSSLDHANDKDLKCDLMLSMGEVYFLRGGLITKQTYIEMALEQARFQQHIPAEIKALADMSRLYNSWGKAEQALIYLESAQVLALNLPDQALELNLQEGEIRAALAQTEPALAAFSRARMLSEREPDRLIRGRVLLRLGQGLGLLGQATQAQADYQAAAKLFTDLGLPFQEAQALTGQGDLLLAANQPARAVPLYQQALIRLEPLKVPVQLAAAYSGLGRAELVLGQTEAAIEHLEKALEQIQMFSQAEERVLREYFEKFAPTFDALIRAYQNIGDSRHALEVLESSRNLYFRQQLSQRSGKSMQFQEVLSESSRNDSDWYLASLPAGTTVISYDQPESEMMLHFRLAQGQLKGMSQLTQALLTESAAWSQYADELNLDPAEPLKSLIMAYRGLVSEPESDPEQLDALSKLLYNLLIAPHASALAGTNRLVIAPDGVLGLLPFETLRMPDGAYLVEKYDIQYLHSLSVLKDLENRDYAAERKSMLALGDPVYQSLSYQRGQLENEQQLLELKRQLWQQPEAPMREAYAALYGELQWDPLPGTRAEVEGIKALLTDTELMMGDQADEASLKALSESGQLAQYRVLHFATHGMAVPEIPELSALILSQYSEERPEDGYLRMPEIASLRLKADFVNLSACETGLGKLYRGEGVVGLSQAFLAAGANRVATSLWPISDAGSAVFMQALYKLANDDNHARALNLVKRAFLKGRYGKDYRHPYYWSPFVIYGRL